MPHVAARTASRDRDTGRYQSHRPEQTLLYQIVDEYYPAFAALMAEQGKELPGYVQREFEEFLQCGRLEHGFLRVRCESCHAEHLVAFSCKRRGFCPSCGARRMAESAALLVDEVLPEQPMRQWVLSFPFQLRFLSEARCGCDFFLTWLQIRHQAGRAYCENANKEQVAAPSGARPIFALLNCQHRLR